MTLYPDEPKTADELVARYRDVKRRLYPVSPRLPNRELPTVDAETILAFAPAAAVPTARALKSGEQAERAQHAVRLAGACAHAGELPTESDRTDVGAEAQAQTQTAQRLNSAESDLHGAGDVIPGAPRRTARAVVRAVSERTSVPVDAILGRQRRSEIAAARHEAIWRVREATKWSLPRVGQFFGGRDHTTVLSSLRRMENRAAEDPELRAYMNRVKQAYSAQRPAPP